MARKGFNHPFATLMSNASNEPLRFDGTFHMAVDAKRRVQFPSEWRPTDGSPLRVTLLPWPKSEKRGAFISICPQSVMDELQAKVKAMKYSDEKAQALRRLISGRSAVVTTDAQGRILLPEHLAAEAGIGTQATFVGSTDRWELWSRERYNQTQAADQALEREAYDLI